jgi:hypothetical protein
LCKLQKTNDLLLSGLAELSSLKTQSHRAFVR